MDKVKSFFKNELTGWKLWEVLWISFSTIVILGLSIYWKDTFVGIMAALTGVWCVILTGKGKLSSFIFGTINTVLYAYVALKAAYYGEVLLNMVYYLPTNFIGMYVWSKNMNKEVQEVKKERLSLKNSIIAYGLVAVGIIGFGYFLKLINGSLPFVDSMSTVISIAAQIFCIKRLSEQWILWIVVNCVSIYLWIMAFINGTGDFATILMWTIYLLNAIFMAIKWFKESNK